MNDGSHLRMKRWQFYDAGRIFWRQLSVSKMPFFRQCCVTFSVSVGRGGMVMNNEADGSKYLLLEQKNEEEGQSVTQISFRAPLSVFLQLSAPPSRLTDCPSKHKSHAHTHTHVYTDQPQTESRALLTIKTMWASAVIRLLLASEAFVCETSERHLVTLFI